MLGPEWVWEPKLKVTREWEWEPEQDWMLAQLKQLLVLSLDVTPVPMLAQVLVLVLV
jgi:hypothetical protein